MANNRMFLVNTATGQRVCLAKRMGNEWYRQHDDVNSKLDEAFESETHKYFAPWGSTAWIIEYEHDEPEHDADLKANCDYERENPWQPEQASKPATLETMDKAVQVAISNYFGRQPGETLGDAMKRVAEMPNPMLSWKNKP